MWDKLFTRTPKPPTLEQEKQLIAQELSAEAAAYLETAISDRNTYETNTQWEVYAKNNPKEIKHFEEELLKLHNHSLPNWYEPFSLWRLLHDSYELTNETFKQFTQKNHEANERIPFAEPDENAAQWYAQARQKEKARIQQLIARIDSKINLKIATDSDRQRKDYLLRDLEIMETSDGQHLAQGFYDAYRLDHENNMWELSLEDYLRSVDNTNQEQINMLAAMETLLRYQDIFRKNKTPTQQDLRQGNHRSWIVFNSTETLNKLLSTYNSAIENWSNSNLRPILGAINQKGKDLSPQQKIKLIKALLKETLPVLPPEYADLLKE